MRLRLMFVILVALLLSICALLIHQITHFHNLLFYSTEGLILITIVYLFYFYRKVIKPYKTIANGMDLLNEQDFATRLRSVGQVEADDIVKIFNRMMDCLKNERLHVREQNFFLDLLIQESPMGVIIMDFDEHITQSNEAGLKMLGVATLKEIAGKTMKEIDSPLAEVMASFEKNSTQTVRLGDTRIFRCSYLSFFDNGFRHPFMLIESLTTEVMMAEKKAYEKVIRMIAHEVNNTTAGISSALDSIRSVIKDLEGTEDLQDVMSVCIDRCYSMSQFITNFADVVKIPQPNMQRVELNKFVGKCKLFLDNYCQSRGVRLTFEPVEEEVFVNIDVTLFEQVMTNIVKNAIESIEKDGEVRISTSLPAQLEIADNGAGISKETEAKLFTPFYSTKRNGQGLGLIFIREVLSNHDCSFSLRTYADGWTRFKIKFTK